MDAAPQIDAIRAEWGDRLLVLGHFYQNAAVLRHADRRGDSLELARAAAGAIGAERIVFCGVRFMAETADILSGPHQAVYMPETSAGCPMADMATSEQVQAALERLGGEWVPVVYVNSSVGVKAVCGRAGGSACTSSNAARVLEWALGKGRKVLFLPDEHLGVNTAAALGLPDDTVAVYDPSLPGGGIDPARLGALRMLVWKGFCIVHRAFTPDVVERIRREDPAAKIIVHPETPREVVRRVDASGSTSQIIRYVRELPDGTTVYIGTELNLVRALAEEHAGRLTVRALRQSVCANMAKTNELNLLDLLRRWPAACRVSVPDETARDARLCLERMLSL